MTAREKEQLFKGFGFSNELSKHLTAALRDAGGDHDQREAGDQKSADEALITLLKTTVEDIRDDRSSRQA